MVILNFLATTFLANAFNNHMPVSMPRAGFGVRRIEQLGLSLSSVSSFRTYDISVKDVSHCLFLCIYISSLPLFTRMSI
jgi:hypothetical protein